MDEQQIVEDQTQELEIKCAEYLAGWKRAMADYENLRKDSAKQIQQAGETGQLRSALQILPLYEHYKLAVGHIPKEQQENDWVQGIMHIKKAFEDFLKSLGIKAIESAGQEFNPELHEAIAEEESALPEGQIVKEVQTGYTMNDKVILPAKVIIAKS
ncbi:MAG: nucleotide exchange factor GrpE [Candidatus Komeilibacteria bacterium]|nr:nucleotide exchange factor GrpE [Candidatus Komeilibacteria bacterium]